MATFEYAGTLPNSNATARATAKGETDPIKKSRIANFLREYWGAKHGGARGQNVHLKTTADIAETIGESHKQTQRLMKLHDLIPQLQRLVSAGKLGTTAGEQLAYLSPVDMGGL